MHFDGIDLGGRTETKVETGIARRLKARVGTDFGGLGQSTGLYLDARAETIAIRADAYGFHAQPMIMLRALVAQYVAQ
jgi:hypothetical protein